MMELLKIDTSGVSASFGQESLSTTYTDALGNVYNINVGTWINLVVIYDSVAQILQVWYNTLETGTIRDYVIRGPLMEL